MLSFSDNRTVIGLPENTDGEEMCVELNGKNIIRVADCQVCTEEAEGQTDPTTLLSTTAAYDTSPQTTPTVSIETTDVTTDTTGSPGSPTCTIDDGLVTLEPLVPPCSKLREMKTFCYFIINFESQVRKSPLTVPSIIRRSSQLTLAAHASLSPY